MNPYRKIVVLSCFSKAFTKLILFFIEHYFLSHSIRNFKSAESAL